MASRAPARKKIAEYWAGEVGLTRFPDNRAALDFGEPVCMACGRILSCDDDKLGTYAAWNSSAGERAHIIPAMYGGSSAPYNFLILCAQCHSESPDFADEDGSAMLEWCASREGYFNFVARVAVAAQDKYGSVADVLPSTLRSMREKQTANIGVHGMFTNRASEEAAIIATIREGRELLDEAAKAANA